MSRIYLHYNQATKQILLVTVSAGHNSECRSALSKHVPQVFSQRIRGLMSRKMAALRMTVVAEHKISVSRVPPNGSVRICRVAQKTKSTYEMGLTARSPGKTEIPIGIAGLCGTSAKTPEL